MAVLSGFANTWNAGTSSATITNGRAWKYGLASVLRHQVKMQPFSAVIFCGAYSVLQFEVIHLGVTVTAQQTFAA